VSLLVKIARDYFEGGAFLSELREEKEILSDILNRIMDAVNCINSNMIDSILVDENGSVLTDEDGNVLVDEL